MGMKSDGSGNLPIKSETVRSLTPAQNAFLNGEPSSKAKMIVEALLGVQAPRTGGNTSSSSG